MQALDTHHLVDSVGPACGTDGVVLGVPPAVPGPELTPQAVVEAARLAGLRGAGGAGFPLAAKLDAVAAGTGPAVVVLNAEEGEPASAKDRWLLRHRPDLALAGLRLAAHAVGADTAYVFLSDPDGAAVMTDLAARSAGDLPLQVVQVAPAYVAGEETSVTRAIDGGPALPLPKPPRPYQAGVSGRPTLVSNIESLVRLALACHPSVGRAAGTTALATVTTGGRAVIREIPIGTTVRELLQSVDPDVDEQSLRGVLLGGFAGGIWPAATALDLPVSHDAMRGTGALWGCGAVITIGDDDCVLAAASDILGYLHDSSAEQCGSCVRGTDILAGGVEALCSGRATPDGVEAVRRRSGTLPGRGNCGMPDGAAALARTLLDHFPDVVDDHLSLGPCRHCTARLARAHRATRFAVTLSA